MHKIKRILIKYEKKGLFDLHTRKNRVQKQQSNKIQIYQKNNKSNHSWFIRRVVTLNIAILR